MPHGKETFWRVMLGTPARGSSAVLWACSHWVEYWMESRAGVNAVNRKIAFFLLSLRSRTPVVRAALDGFTESAFYVVCSERHLFVTLCEHYWHLCGVKFFFLVAT